MHRLAMRTPTRAGININLLERLAITKTAPAEVRRDPAYPRFGGCRPGLSAHRRASSSVEMRFVGLGFFSGLGSSDFSVMRTVYAVPHRYRSTKITQHVDFK